MFMAILIGAGTVQWVCSSHRRRKNLFCQRDQKVKGSLSNGNLQMEEKAKITPGVLRLLNYVALTHQNIFVVASFKRTVTSVHNLLSHV